MHVKSKRSAMIHFERYAFHPVIALPKDYEVYDFSLEYDPDRTRKSPYGIGKYNEKRAQMYTAEIFGGVRDIHMGIDIAAPVATPVYSFYDGEIFLFGNNDKPGDYGHTLITRHRFEGEELYALFGHLSQRSLENKRAGQATKKGEVIAWVGDKSENGGWNPH